MPIALGLLLLIGGALAAYSWESPWPWLDLHVVGLICMVGGALSLLLFILSDVRRRQRRRRTRRS